MAKSKLRSYADGRKAFGTDGNLVIPEIGSMEIRVSEHWGHTPTLDLLSRDICLDLSAYDMQDVNFDVNTKFSDLTKCPKGWNKRNEILELGKDPGLYIRSLHKKGIDGGGLSMAVIDQPLSDHVEYHDNLVHYEEFGYDKVTGSMHGSAVASIAVGKTCGVAPNAKLYYFAANNKKIKNGQVIRTADYRIQALERILKINESLPDKDKIQVVSISAGWMGSVNTEKSEEWKKVLEKVKKTGLFVLTTASRKEYGLGFNGLGKKVYGNPNQTNSYLECPYNLPQSYIDRKNVFVLMDHRTTASPTGKNDYFHLSDGGFSWATPWLAAVFLLARQVNPTVTPEHFWKLALKTGIFSPKVHGTIIQPVKLIKVLQKEMHSSNIKKIMATGQSRAIKRKNMKQNNLQIIKGEQNAK